MMNVAIRTFEQGSIMMRDKNDKLFISRTANEEPLKFIMDARLHWEQGVQEEVG
jgi:hypothetical protein